MLGTPPHEVRVEQGEALLRAVKAPGLPLLSATHLYGLYDAEHPELPNTFVSFLKVP